MSEADSALKAALAGSKDALEDVLNIVFEWVLPIITLLVGFYFGNAIGLSSALYTLLDGVIPTTVTATTVAWVADLVAIAVWVAIGGMLWHTAGGGTKVAGKPDIRKWILRPLSTLFFGFAASEASNLIKGQVAPAGGMLTKATAKIAPTGG
jgi:hypothetical protein